jgi:hypothetical protein
MTAVLALSVSSGQKPISEVLIAALAAVAGGSPEELIDDTFYKLTPKSKVHFLELNSALDAVKQAFPGQLEYALFGAFGSSALRP